MFSLAAVSWHSTTSLRGCAASGISLQMLPIVIPSLTISDTGIGPAADCLPSQKLFRGIVDHERWATKDLPAAEEAAEAAEALGDKAGEAAAAAAQAILDAGKSETAAREAGKAAAKAAASGESIADAIKDGYSAGKVTDAALNAGMSREVLCRDPASRLHFSNRLCTT